MRVTKRTEDEDELQKRGANGGVRASRFIRRYANSRKGIAIDTVREMHREIFKDVWAEIAGRYRDENLEITDSKHLPPHHSQVTEKINAAETELAEFLKKLDASKVE